MTPAESRASLRATMARCDVVQRWARRFLHEGMARSRHDGIDVERGIALAAERAGLDETEVTAEAAHAAQQMARGAGKGRR